MSKGEEMIFTVIAFTSLNMILTTAVQQCVLLYHQYHHGNEDVAQFLLAGKGAACALDQQLTYFFQCLVCFASLPYRLHVQYLEPFLHNVVD